MILKALYFAKKAHAGQVRKYTGTPYVDHPIRIASKVMMRPDATEAMVVAALLHDVVEDTSYRLEHITDEFGVEVAKLVDELTNKSNGSKLPRAERKKMDRDQLASASRTAKIIKLLDRLDNLQEMAGADDGFKRKYADESYLLVDTIGDVDPLLASLVRETAEQLILNPDACPSCGTRPCEIDGG